MYKDYSDSFVISQYNYYKSLLPASGRDANMIIGLFQQFESVCKQRGLI